jgi:glutathione-independent formaldehyde dehydrogenase
MKTARAGGAIGIPGLYIVEDPGAPNNEAKQGSLSLRLGQGWSKSQAFFTGQTPVLKYNQQFNRSDSTR